jgi:hypothetical protein
MSFFVSLKNGGGLVGFFCDILITDFSLGESSSIFSTEMDASPTFSVPPFGVLGDLWVTVHLGDIFLQIQ